MAALSSPAVEPAVLGVQNRDEGTFRQICGEHLDGARLHQRQLIIAADQRMEHDRHEAAQRRTEAEHEKAEREWRRLEQKQ